MFTKKYSLAQIILFALIPSILFISCKKDANPTTDISIVSPITKASYVWGDMSFSRTTFDDVITYTNDGRIRIIVTSGKHPATVNFTYQGNSIFLNTPNNDEYELDDKGRVSVHYYTTSAIHKSQHFTYDNDGYLKTVIFKIGNIDSGLISYEVKGGNYTKMAYSGIDGSNIIRRYNISYAKEKVNSAYSFFGPVLSPDTYSCMEKYLNFGKQSVNLPAAIQYYALSWYEGEQSGTLTVQSTYNDNRNLTGFELKGAPIVGKSYDNLSPFPRIVKFELGNSGVDE